VNARADPSVFGEITRRYLDQGFFRGAVLRVQRGARLLYEEAWGHALVTEEERLPMLPSTLFDLASVSKLFTTTAVLRLATTGAIGLDARITELLDLGPPLGGSLRGVDLRALLAHSSGILPWYPFYTRRSEPFLRILADVLRANPRRPEVIYSDLNFILLGLVIQRATGEGLRQAVGSLVLRPLELRRSGYARAQGPAAATENGNRIEKRMVADLGLSFDGWRSEEHAVVGEPNDGNCLYFFQGASGHAGLFSDASDVCRLGRLYLEEGRIDGESWLSPGLAEEAMREHAGGRGLGFQLGEVFPPGACGHTGFTGTCLILSPPTGIVAALLTNRLHVPEPRDISPYRREMLEAVVTVCAPGGGSFS
jgi:CubicO group peptidase (beta-lactamase class C family)